LGWECVFPRKTIRWNYFEKVHVFGVAVDVVAHEKEELGLLLGKHFPDSEGVALCIVTRTSRGTCDGNFSKKRKGEEEGEKTFHNRKV